MNPLTSHEFKDALSKGLGRVFLHIQEFGVSDFKEDILHACLNNLVYDAQCEENRAEWFLSILELTNLTEVYAPKIYNALANASEIWDVAQLFELTKLLVHRGFANGKQAIYEKFDKQNFNEEWLGGYQIIEIDGIDGFLHVARIISNRLANEEDYWIDDDIIEFAYEQIGKEQVISALRQASHREPELKIYLEEIEKINTTQSKFNKAEYIKKRRNQFSLNKILSNIEAKKWKYPHRYSIFGKIATQDELITVFDKLLSENRNSQLMRYLWVFRQCEFPRLDPKLFQVARSTDKELQEAAIYALANSKDESIRELGVDLIQSPNSEIRLLAIRLFINNYQSGDNKYIEGLLKNIKDKHEIHWAYTDIIKIASRNQPQELLKTLLYAYEQTPCSTCREKVVKILIKNNLIPDNILLECQFDCVRDVRNIAKKRYISAG